jgi:NAD-dependent SIR2 family protein deacetylase
LIEGLANLSDKDPKKRSFKKIVFLTGAGISVSAGIPDFRTPGSGLYSQLEKYNLPFPEAIFEINFFKQAPEAFYKLSKEFLTCGSHPTICHFFISELNRRNKLLINFS